MENEINVLSSDFILNRDKLLGNVANKINEFKAPELIFTSEKDVEQMAGFIGSSMASVVIPEKLVSSKSWRSIEQNGVCNVADSVVLVTEKAEYGEGVQYSTDLMYSAASDSGALKKVKNGIENINAAVNSIDRVFSGNMEATPMPEDSFISRFNGMRYLKSIESTGISDITFKFRIGQGGLFDARKEVVEPIVAIASCFSPKRTADGFVDGPAPTKAKLMSTVAETLFKTLNSSGITEKSNKYSSFLGNNDSDLDNGTSPEYTYEEIAIINKWEREERWKDNLPPGQKTPGKITKKEALKDRGKGEQIINYMTAHDEEVAAKAKAQDKMASSGALGFAAELEKGLMNALNAAAYNALTCGKTRTCSIKIGHMLFGPYFAGNINWNFDYTNVDENGWPCAGNIQLSDLKPVLVIDRFDLRAKLGISKAYTPAKDDGNWYCPLKHITVTSPFGYRIKPTSNSQNVLDDKAKLASDASRQFGGATVNSDSVSYHYGVDLSGVTNTAVFSAYNGEVISAEFSQTYGNRIIIKHTGEKNGWKTYYCHLESMDVCVGDKVATGEHIGLLGSTGMSTGPHLHFEMENGKKIDPAREITAIMNGEIRYQRVSATIAIDVNGTTEYQTGKNISF